MSLWWYSAYIHTVRRHAFVCFYHYGLLQSKSTQIIFALCIVESFKTNVTKNAIEKQLISVRLFFYDYCFALRHQMSPEIKNFAGNLSALSSFRVLILSRSNNSFLKPQITYVSWSGWRHPEIGSYYPRLDLAIIKN